MFKKLLTILDIQEIDMKMLRLLQLRQTHRDRLKSIHDAQEKLRERLRVQHEKVLSLKKDIKTEEGEIAEVSEKIKKLEGQQSLVKRVDEFNALTHETSEAERKRTAKEQRLRGINENLMTEEELMSNIQQQLDTSIENNRSVQDEIQSGILQVNQEGRALKSERDHLVNSADPEVFRIYERLLRNKKDRVVVPIENRCCSGCHIMLTAQDENLVRKGERIVFCEHCSRIHYWQESEELSGTAVATKQRRRKKA